MYADENVIKIKHAVLREVAKQAFEGTLDAQRDHIAVRLIPGPTPQFRCLILITFSSAYIKSPLLFRGFY